MAWLKFDSIATLLFDFSTCFYYVHPATYLDAPAGNRQHHWHHLITDAFRTNAATVVTHNGLSLLLELDAGLALAVLLYWQVMIATMPFICNNAATCC